MLSSFWAWYAGAGTLAQVVVGFVLFSLAVAALQAARDVLVAGLKAAFPAPQAPGWGSHDYAKDSAFLEAVMVFHMTCHWDTVMGKHGAFVAAGGVLGMPAGAGIPDQMLREGIELVCKKIIDSLGPKYVEMLEARYHGKGNLDRWIAAKVDHSLLIAAGTANARSASRAVLGRSLTGEGANE